MIIHDYHIDETYVFSNGNVKISLNRFDFKSTLEELSADVTSEEIIAKAKGNKLHFAIGANIVRSKEDIDLNLNSEKFKLNLKSSNSFVSSSGYFTDSFGFDFSFSYGMSNFDLCDFYYFKAKLDDVNFINMNCRFNLPYNSYLSGNFFRTKAYLTDEFGASLGGLAFTEQSIYLKKQVNNITPVIGCIFLSGPLSLSLPGSSYVYNPVNTANIEASTKQEFIVAGINFGNEFNKADISLDAFYVKNVLSDFPYSINFDYKKGKIYSSLEETCFSGQVIDLSEVQFIYANLNASLKLSPFEISLSKKFLIPLFKFDQLRLSDAVSESSSNNTNISEGVSDSSIKELLERGLSLSLKLSL